MAKEGSPAAVYLKDYKKPGYLIKSVELDFDLREPLTRVSSKIHFLANPGARELILNGEGFKTLSLKVNEQQLDESDYEISDNRLLIKSPPDEFVFESVVELNPDENTALEGLYRSSGIYCTQCEAEGFRRITWYLDRPDVLSTFTTRIEADKHNFPVLLSNGNPLTSGDLENGRHFAVWEDPHPKPSYLFALVAGDLLSIGQDYVTASGKAVKLAIYVEKENIDKCDYAMQSLVKAMRWDEEHYGREYDLDVFNIVAVNDFNMGAMENKGLNVFNSKYILASPDTATDKDYQGIEGVVAHEYFHNWTGNRITCRDWFQLSLKEGLTVFRDQEFSADMGSRGVKRIEDVALLRANQFVEDASPMAHPVRPASYIEINNFYTLTVYEKGAEVVRMQANLLGTESYRKAMDIYFERYDGQAVTTEDFVDAMETASERDLSQFKNWYDYAGTPEIKVSGSYNGEAQSYKLAFSQSVPDTPGQSNKPPFHIPVAMGLLDKNGNDLTGNRIIELTERSQEFTFEDIASEPVPSLLRGFSAPVNLKFDFTDDDLMLLMSKDSDGFNRWNAAQELSKRLVLNLIQGRHDGIDMEVPESYLGAFRESLLDPGQDLALVAEIMTLPALAWIGEFMPTIDVDGLFLAREKIKTEISGALRADLLATYESLREAGEYLVDAEHIGRRKLKNRCLAYLMAEPTSESIMLCLNQYGDGHNMTDVLAALALLADSNLEEKAEVLEDFSARWKHDVLVMDKWFAVQAMSTADDTLANITRLMNHSSFSMTNPNKVRSLIGSFAAGNPLRFHAIDGSGYAFLVDRIIELDPVNPQIAARLLRNMARWQRYDTVRQGLMCEQLERVLSIENISRDSFEVASKSLKEVN